PWLSQRGLLDFYHGLLGRARNFSSKSLRILAAARCQMPGAPTQAMREVVGERLWEQGPQMAPCRS
ncbi:MAG: hypothetical protein ACE5GX_19000, partial [Thermoanaerobaculia bacterium]